MRLYLPIAWVMAVAMVAGCDAIPKSPPPQEYVLTSPFAGVRTVAVAPVANQSGSRDVDCMFVADELFKETQLVRGLNVLPLNKTLAAMQQLKMRSVDSPEAAQTLAEVLGADYILVAAVTHYDPYRPPTMGMTAQLYTPRRVAAAAAADPEARSIDGSPVRGEGVPPAPAGQGAGQPVVHVAAMYAGTNQTVLKELKEFAAGRSDYGSALIEDRYLADMDAYTRFVCHATLRRLLSKVENPQAVGR